MLKNLDQLFMTYKFSPIPIASDATSTEHLSEGSLNLYACSILVAEIKQGWRRMTQMTNEELGKFRLNAQTLAELL